VRLPLYIAVRYLFAKKSHNVINIISAISAIGMALGTAALILILSVYNGFDSIIRNNISNEEADLRIVSADGKPFIPEGKAFDELYENDGLGSICSILEENIFLTYGSQQSIAKARGVDENFEKVSALSSQLQKGKWKFHEGDMDYAVVNSALSAKLGINPAFLTPIELFFPDRKAAISIRNPASSLHSVKVFPSAVVQSYNTDSSESEDIIMVPIEVLRSLGGFADEELSYLELRFAEGLDHKQQKKFQKTLQEQLGDGFKVQDRFMQNESIYKMMRTEKAAIFMILIFVVLIIALNIFGSLSMLMIEKKEDIGTLKALGADDALIRKIFLLEGWLISLSGMMVGLVIGIALALLQQQFGFVKMPGANYIMDAYPVVLKLSDIVLTAIGVSLIGLIVAVAPLARKEIKQ